jgi:hypothetical protein
MKMMLPLLLAALALPAGATDYYLRGDDTGSNCSLNGAGSPYGWATTSGGAQVRKDTSDSSGVFHIDGHLMRIAVTTDNLSFGGARLVFDGSLPAINDKYSENKTLTLDHVYVPAGKVGELRCGDKNTKVVAGADWVVESGARLLLNIGEEGSPRNWICSATVTGQGTFAAASGVKDSRVWDANSATASGTVTLTGDLSGFTGRLSAGENGMTWTGTQSSAIANLKLVIGAASALPVSTPDGDVMLGSVCVTNGATISFSCNATSPDIRGWDFGSGAVPTVNVDSGKTVYIYGPVAGTVGFKKTGSGTLVLNVGGEGAYDTITLTGASTVSASTLSTYVAKCEQWLEDRSSTATAPAIFFF